MSDPAADHKPFAAIGARLIRIRRLQRQLAYPAPSRKTCARYDVDFPMRFSPPVSDRAFSARHAAIDNA
jgi:hypothetical protein